MKNKILTVLAILFGLMMINSGLNKFLHYMPMPEMSNEMMQLFNSFLAIQWLLPLVAAVEITGGILMAIPRTRALGALVILPVVVGIVLHHLVHDLHTLPVPFVLMAINLWVIAENKERYFPMLKGSRG